MSASIGAVVLAAGQSRRMGQPKLVLPWGDRTVIEQVVITLQAAGVAQIVVVTGGAADRVTAALDGYAVRLVHNPDYAASEMLDSLRIGMAALSVDTEALLIMPGDQPLLDAPAVRAVITAYERQQASLVVPSRNNRRGHPWLVARALWPAILTLRDGQTLRDFLSAHEGEILYVLVESPGVLQDIDTPEDYAAQHPK